MSQKQVWNEVVFPSLEAAFDRLQHRTEVMVRDEVAREFARQQSKAQHPSNGSGATCIPADAAQAYIGELKEALNTYCQPLGKNEAAS